MRACWRRVIRRRLRFLAGLSLGLLVGGLGSPLVMRQTCARIPVLEERLGLLLQAVHRTTSLQLWVNEHLIERLEHVEHDQRP